MSLALDGSGAQHYYWSDDCPVSQWDAPEWPQTETETEPVRQSAQQTTLDAVLPQHATAKSPKQQVEAQQLAASTENQSFPESQESTERERDSRSKDETTLAENAENTEQTLEQRDGDGPAMLSDFSISRGTDPTIVFSSVVPTPVNHSLCFANHSAVICSSDFGRSR